MEKQDLTVLWLDDRRDPIAFFKKARAARAKGNGSGAGERILNFYDREIYSKYNVTFDWVKNIEEFQEYITTNGIPEFVSFDRDLTTDKNNPIPDGIECAKWLRQYCEENGENMPKCFAHTANVKQLPELEYVLGDAALREPCVGDNAQKYEKALADFRKRQGINENRKRLKVTLTESQLRRVIKESVKNVLNEKKNRVFDAHNQGKYECLKNILRECGHQLYKNNFLYNVCQKYNIDDFEANFGDGNEMANTGFRDVNYAAWIGQMLKNCGYSKSYSRFMQAMQYLQEAAKLFEAASQDVNGNYPEDDDFEGGSVYDSADRQREM